MRDHRDNITEHALANGGRRGVKRLYCTDITDERRWVGQHDGVTPMTSTVSQACKMKSN